MVPSDSELDICFTGQPEGFSDTVSATALARVLDGLQRVVHLIGMRLDGRTLDRRARPSQDIQQRFVLLCEVPRKGSYHQIVRLASFEPRQPSLFNELKLAEQEFERFLSAVGDSDEHRLSEAVPDAAYRRFMLDALAETIPDPRSGIGFEISVNGRKLLQSSYARSFLEHQRRPRMSAPSAGIVNGELTKIDFLNHRITLRLLGVKRDISCSYEDSVEATLLEHPRELIQVFGSVVLDHKGVPEAIEAVEDIRPINESEELPVDTFIVQNMKVQPQKPLKIVIQFDRDEQLFTAKVSDFGIEAVAETRDEAVDAAIAELRLLWRKYAQEEDERLTDSARRLKADLREAFKEINNAA